jgi:hypothetical protein
LRVTGYRPRNEFLLRELDSRWRRWVSLAVLSAAAAALVLGAAAGPRQTAIRLRYDISRLQREVELLEQQRRRLELDREALTSPTRLTLELATLGLEQVGTDRVAFLTADGRLVRPPAPQDHARSGSGSPRP